MEHKEDSRTFFSIGTSDEDEDTFRINSISQHYDYSNSSPFDAISRKVLIPMKSTRDKWSGIRHSVSTNDSKPKIVAYTAKDLNFWAAFLHISGSYFVTKKAILLMITWIIIVVLSYLFTYYTGFYKSAAVNDTISGKVQLLISFVLASYVTNVVLRWDRVMTTLVAQVSDCLETIMFLLRQQIGNQENIDEKVLEQHVELLIRYCRLTLKLIFRTAQDDDNLKALVDEELLTESEFSLLSSISVTSRPITLIMWLQSYLEGIAKKDIIPGFSIAAYQGQLISLRVAMISVLRVAKTPLPYSYCHLVHWIVQAMIIVLASQTGAVIADLVYQQYTVNVPDPQLYFVGYSIAIVIANAFYSIFAEALLSVVDELSNPLAKSCSSVSETVIGKLRYKLLFF